MPKGKQDKQETRCGSCGRVLPDGERTARIAFGVMKSGKFVEEQEYALLHRNPCFVRAIDCPAAALAELHEPVRQAG